MSKHFSIKKGLNIQLVGEAEKITKDTPNSKVYSLILSDFHGITPKLIAKQGSEVKAGEPIFFSKTDENLTFASPVSGEIVEVVRGEKRKILEIKILADSDQVHQQAEKINVSAVTVEDIKQYFSANGLWPFIKQRPYDVIANPQSAPKAIYISATATAPLSPDYDYALAQEKEAIQAGINALAKLTEGKVHVSIAKAASNSVFRGLNNCKLHEFSGPHPAGNVSTQIAKIDPINKGEIVWTVNPADLAIIGKHLLTGKLDVTRTIAITGSEVKNPHYVRVKIGQKVEDILNGLVDFEANSRIISGNVLTGSKKSKEEAIGFYDNQITVIPEGDDYDFFGWNLPRPNKFSLLRANMFSFLTPNKKYDLNTSTNGEHRAFVLTGHYEKVFPLDIYPMQLLKSVMYKDIDEMEKLGIYEVAPEDFALTEFICPSKMNHQEIIREGLDLMIKEVG